MQNFDAYMVETGAALADLGEHYRYTHDDQWVKQIAPKLIKSCEFIQRWRQRNQREDLRGWRVESASLWRYQALTFIGRSVAVGTAPRPWAAVIFSRGYFDENAQALWTAFRYKHHIHP